eukprot:jgi/Botrbrau1/13866/Bobra.0056s0099.1
MRRRRRGNGCTARATDPASVEPPRESEYNDTWSDVAFIALCRKAYGNIAGWQSPRGWTDGKETYAGMVEVSRALMKARHHFHKIKFWFKFRFSTATSVFDTQAALCYWVPIGGLAVAMCW